MKHWLLVASVMGFLSVAGGAFGAHALKEHVSPERMITFETGTQYAQFHVAVLLLLALMPAQHGRLQNAACAAFTIGIIVFTGSLWCLTITGITWLGAITPFGGLSFLAGWVMLALSAMRRGEGQDASTRQRATALGTSLD